LTSDADGTVFVRNPIRGAIRNFFTQFDADTQVGWSPDGSKIAALGFELAIYDLASSKEIAAPEDYCPG